jgi:hypothetical protein
MWLTVFSVNVILQIQRRWEDKRHPRIHTTSSHQVTVESLTTLHCSNWEVIWGRKVQYSRIKCQHTDVFRYEVRGFRAVKNRIAVSFVRAPCRYHEVGGSCMLRQNVRTQLPDYMLQLCRRPQYETTLWFSPNVLNVGGFTVALFYIIIGST